MTSKLMTTQLMFLDLMESVKNEELVYNKKELKRMNDSWKSIEEKINNFKSKDFKNIIKEIDDFNKEHSALLNL